MNYIILNDINSQTIPGLLIQELPPIIKPNIRTEITQIEGRDGDIIDKSGYQSYNKIIKIGLYKNYDIDQIIEYFDFQGEATFSNEADKIYVCEVLDNINFERLIKMKEANVSFHTQPFKYLKDEAKIDETITTQTQISVINQGLEPSKPIITLYGTDVVQIIINNLAVFELNFSQNPDAPDEYLTVDSNIEDCYKDNTQTLKNRSMIGEFPILKPGENIITWTGDLTRIIIEPKSRWL